MVDLAAATVPQWRPDFYIIAYITNDLIRPRFWLVDRTLRGRERMLMTLSPRATPDPATMTDVSDYLQINPDISREWCDRMTAARATGDVRQLDNDPLTSAIVQDHVALARENGAPAFAVKLWGRSTLRTSFLYNRIVRGNPFIGVALQNRASGMPPSRCESSMKTPCSASTSIGCATPAFRESLSICRT